MDLGWPLQARATKIHAWCKWITHGKTFHYSGNWFHSGNAFTVEKRNIFHVTKRHRRGKNEQQAKRISLLLILLWEMRRVMMRTSASHIAPYCPWKCVSLRTSCLTSMCWKLHGAISSKEKPLFYFIARQYLKYITAMLFPDQLLCNSAIFTFTLVRLQKSVFYAPPMQFWCKVRPP